MYEGEEGYIVITPLQRSTAEPGSSGSENTVLINRGWISKKLKDQKDRPEGLPQGEVVVEGLIRDPVKKNYFTPDNRPDKGEFYFPDIEQMAQLTGSQPVLIEETMGAFAYFRFLLWVYIEWRLLTTCSARSD